MTVTDSGSGGPREAQTQSFEPLIAAGVSDRCSTCGAELAADQRYCVECGTRRGRARFSLPSARPAAPGVIAEGAPPPAGPFLAAPARTISSGGALLGTIALLLLAMGVGVLIGNSGHPAASAPRVIVNGAGSGGAGPASAGSAGTAASTSGSAQNANSGASRGKASKATSSGAAKSGPVSASATLHPATVNPSSLHTTAQRKKALVQTIQKTVPLKNGKHLAPETQTLGGACSAGTVGCTNGKYTGQFF